MRASEGRERENNKVYFWNEIDMYNFTPNPRLTKIFTAFFNFLGVSIFQISVVQLTHVRTGVCQATSLFQTNVLIIFKQLR